MKTKAVCAATGLTRKALLLYEEKGLVTPEKRWSNGREYRDYSESAVQTLREIAILRRAWFTLEEIQCMQQHPSKTEEIFLQYLQWLQTQQSALSALLEAAESVRRAGPPQNLSALARSLDRAARGMPEPHFRYLDDLESPPPHVTAQTNLEEDGGNAGFWTLRMVREDGLRPVNYEDMIRGLGLRDYSAELENGTVPQSIDRDGPRLKAVKRCLEGLAAGFGLMLLLWWIGYPDFYLRHGAVWGYLTIIGLAASLLLLGILCLYSFLRDRRHPPESRSWPGLR